MSDDDNFEDAAAEPTAPEATPAADTATPVAKEKKPRAPRAPKAPKPAAAAKEAKVSKAAKDGEPDTPTKPRSRPKSKPAAPVAPVPEEEKAIIAAAQPDVPAVARARRWHPGTVARREINKLQKSTDIVMRHAPFERRLRYLMKKYVTPDRDSHFSADAISLLEEAYQNDCVSIFQDLVQNSCHGDRATVMEKDLILWRHYINKYTNINAYASHVSEIIPSKKQLAIAQ